MLAAERITRAFYEWEIRGRAGKMKIWAPADQADGKPPARLGRQQTSGVFEIRAE